MFIANRIARRHRQGSISVLAAFFTIGLLGMVAFCVDLGYILSAKEELQRTADSAAIAACWELGQRFSNGDLASEVAIQTRQVAQSYANINHVTNQSPAIDTNPSNGPQGDVQMAYIADFINAPGVLDVSNPDLFNAVRVRVRKNADINGKVPYFFAKIFGLSGQDLQAEAMAAFVRDVAGFQVPADGSCIDLLPFALDHETWILLMDNVVGEFNNIKVENNWAWDEATETITYCSAGSADDWVEVNLYPQDTGSPGNRGTVDIGSSNNSTADIARQILYGVSPEDLAQHGGFLQLNSDGVLYLDGDTGISAGFKDELAAIKGQPRCIPIFSDVNGPGNTAVYTISGWVGVRIMDVKLTGPMSKKHITIQIATVQCKGVIPSTTTGTSDHVFSTVVLVD
jgi:Flp pilus assembly protein TadG